ncbi:unnamed protein product [Lactuca virosa]|uniref:Uncharacterized protein n=1 Tax=Lactuca virosa TaxID=75947 RepID=A0AAU9LM83_9ASTR|nr:unnamed protein product [Lactuca virosa]
MQGAPKQPSFDKGPSGTIPEQIPLSNQTKSPAASEMSDYDDLIAGLQGKNPSSNNIFVPKWNLTNQSRISSREVAMEFSCHAFPKESIVEMEAFTNDQTIDFMEFPSAQSAFLLAAGARCI